MDINVLIICITVALCVIFAAATVAYVADRRRTKAQAMVEFVAHALVVAAKEFDGDGQ